MTREDHYALDLELFDGAVGNGDGPEPFDAPNAGAGFARLGLKVLPVVMAAVGGRRPKEPPAGYIWPARASTNVSEVVQDFEEAGHRYGSDNLGVGWALGLDGYVAVDLDRAPPPWWPELAATPHAVNITARGSHLVWRFPEGLVPGNSTRRFPSQEWGEVRGVGGYIVIAAADRPGFDATQLAGLPPFPRPEWLTASDDNVRAASTVEVQRFIEEHAEALRAGAIKGPRRKLDEWCATPHDQKRPAARHDMARDTACWLARESAAGWYPASGAFELLREWWRRVMDTPADAHRTTNRELPSIVSWAVGQAVAEPERIAAMRVEAPRPAPPRTETSSEPNLPEEFWRSRPRLLHIRQAAHARTRSADAVLGAVLARVAMLTPPSLVLPAVTSDVGSFDVIIGLIARPGGGKSSAISIGRRLVPTGRTDVVDGLPVGSGEGLVDAYLGAVEEVGPDGKKKRVRQQVMTAVLAVVDEGQALAELGGRKGSTLITTLRTAWSGGDLGQANATVETHRHIRAGRYRFAALVAWQPRHAAVILDDEAGGLAQRVLWLPATDPSIPDDAPPWPGALDWTPPAVITGGAELDVDPALAADIRARQLEQARGNSDAGLDGHDDLGQLKIAGLLAILDDRNDVTADDWYLAEMVMATSRRVRRTVSLITAVEAERRDQANIGRAIRRETALADTAEARAFTSATRSVGRRAHRDGAGVATTRRDLARAIAGKHRELVDVDAVIAGAVSDGWIEQAGETFKPGRSAPT